MVAFTYHLSCIRKALSLLSGPEESAVTRLAKGPYGEPDWALTNISGKPGSFSVRDWGEGGKGEQASGSLLPEANRDSSPSGVLAST